MHRKQPYICYPLTELPPETREQAKSFYVQIADACEHAIGVRGFVPHEDYDPVKHAHFSPEGIDTAVRKQICYFTFIVIVVAIAPSWGGGIEVEMANRYGIPVFILCEKEKLEKRLISRLLRGNPAVKGVIAYTDEHDAISQLTQALRKRYFMSPVPKR